MEEKDTKVKKGFVFQYKTSIYENKKSTAHQVSNNILLSVHLTQILQHADVRQSLSREELTLTGTNYTLKHCSNL